MVSIQEKFGVEGYVCKDVSYMKEPLYNIQKICLSKNMKPSGFMDLEVKRKKWVPAANYEVIYDWNKINSKKGKFLKGPKVTYTDSIIHQSKRKNYPAPGAYKTNELFGKTS
jgi:hypothetical protein